MSDQDLMKLYSAQILSLAADIPHTDRIAGAVTVKKRAPVCGSTVEVDLIVEDGIITRYGQNVKACALGQAAASIIGNVIVGLTEETVREGRMQLSQMLKADGPVPAAPFEGFKILEPARDFGNRHASILLTFDAIIEALDQMGSA
ncbi:MAG: iron-sulfur cluster assembly scaffold protein [Halocynthiibacter sp.]